MLPWKEPIAAAVLVAYDCPASDHGERRRRRLRKICRPIMERVQYSVYMGHVARTAIPPLQADLQAAIDPSLDRLLVADLGAGEWRNYGQGMPAVRLPPAALVVVADSHAGLAAAAAAGRAQRTSPESASTASATAPGDVVDDAAGPCQRIGRSIDQAGERIRGFMDWLRADDAQ